MSIDALEVALVALYLPGLPRPVAPSPLRWPQTLALLRRAASPITGQSWFVEAATSLHRAGSWDEALVLTDPPTLNLAARAFPTTLTVASAAYPARWVAKLGGHAPPALPILNPQPAAPRPPLVEAAELAGLRLTVLPAEPSHSLSISSTLTVGAGAQSLPLAIALSDAVFITSCEFRRGDAWSVAVSTLRNRQCPLLVSGLADSGSWVPAWKALVALGARPLTISLESPPDAIQNALLEAVHRPNDRPWLSRPALSDPVTSNATLHRAAAAW